MKNHVIRSSRRVILGRRPKAATCALSLIVLSLWFLPAVLSAQGDSKAAGQIKVAMTPEHWKTKGAAEFVKHNGFDSLALKAGLATLNDLSFRNGTIEFDLEPKAMGAGIEFRLDKDACEMVYLRPRADCSEKKDCIQYAPTTHGVLLWDFFPQFQSSAPLKLGEWNHVKLVVSGERLNVFVNEAISLKVGRLEGDIRDGELVLAGPGFFANLTITPDAVEGLSAEAEKDPTASDSRYIRNWRISNFYKLPAAKAPDFADLPEPSTAWVKLAAERGGLVNISRKYGQPVPLPDRAVAWLKTTITSDKSQTKKAAIGWNREVWVFVNGQLVYTEKNLFQPPAARKSPDGRCSLDNGSFAMPLKAGKNEVTVALAANFYGWGLILRLEDADGVQLDK
jgi:hypothetical protein